MTEDPPLLDLFEALRKKGVPLGIDEYFAAVRALQGGFGIDSPQSLANLCKALWLTGKDDQEIFRKVFADWLAAYESTLSKEEAEAQRKSPSEDLDDQDLSTIRPKKMDGDRDSFSDSTNSQSDSADREGPLGTTSPIGPDLVRAWKLKDIQRAVQWAEQKAVPEDVAAAGRYSFDYSAYPISLRHMQQGWRYLRRPERAGPPVELDIKKTVKKIAEEGYLIEPVLVPRRTNQVRLSLLVDYGGSMTPFHYVADHLVETAIRGGRLGETDIYYFLNQPRGRLYHDKLLTQAEPLDEWLLCLSPTESVVLIFSDGGAARRRLRLHRVRGTLAFLDQLNNAVRNVAWLNPIPAERWPNTSAGEIAEYVNMFPLSREGMSNAIYVLRGRIPKFEVKGG